MIEKKEFLAKGKRGITYLAEHEGKTVVVKEENPDSDAVGALENEYEFLKELNGHGIGPEAIGFEDGRLLMEYVSGQMIIDYLKAREEEDIREVLRQVFDKLRRMDELGVNKDEMTYPYKHIIVGADGPRMIDFERCRWTESPQNVTQFCQFLMSKRISDILEEKGFDFDKPEVIENAKKYKDSYSEDAYEDLMEVFGL